MRARVIDIAHDAEVNPDQMVAFAEEYRNIYDTFWPLDGDDAVENLENVTINSSKKDKLVKKFKYDNRKGHDWRENLVPESLDEAMDFERGKDPKKAMGLGKKVQIEKDLEEAGINPMSVIITDDLIIKNKSVWDSQINHLRKIQLKYLHPEYKKFILKLMDSKITPEIAVNDAIDAGLEPAKIKELIDEFGKYKEGYQTIDKKTPAIIQLSKATRDEEKIREDEEYNNYAFIAFPDKVPVMVNGKKYYEEGWGTEGMIKIDKFDTSSLHNITGMKLRARYSGRNASVYFMRVTKDFMDEEWYNEFPDIIQQNFDDYLARGIIRKI